MLLFHQIFIQQQYSHLCCHSYLPEFPRPCCTKFRHGKNSGVVKITKIVTTYEPSYTAKKQIALYNYATSTRKSTIAAESCILTTMNYTIGLVCSTFITPCTVILKDNRTVIRAKWTIVYCPGITVIRRRDNGQ